MERTVLGDSNSLGVPSRAPQANDLEKMGLEPRPIREEAREQLLKTRLTELPIPTRLQNWARRNSIETVGEVAAIGEERLLEERNLGRTTIAQFNQLLLEHGSKEGLRKLHRFLVPEGAARISPERGADDGSGRAEASRWDELEGLLPEVILAAPVKLVDLPKRMENHCKRMGIETIGELVGHRAVDLLEARNIGRGTIRESLASINAFSAKVLGEGGSADCSSPEIPPLVFGAEDRFETVWKRELQSIPFQERLVISRRAGLVGTGETLETIGDLLGVTRERVRQIEKKGVRRIKLDRRWVDALAERLDLTLAGKVKTLEEVAEDPFWERAPERPNQIRFLLRKILDRGHLLVRWGKGWAIAPSPAVEPEKAFMAFVRDRNRSFPIARAELEAQAREEAEKVGVGWGELFEERLDEEFLFDDERRTVLGRGSTKTSLMSAFLIAQGRAVALAELQERFGRLPIPRDVLYVDLGVVIHVSAIEGFEVWERRLVPECVRIMEERGPELQWTAVELMDALQDCVEVPPFLTPWILTGMLRRSGAVDDLRRQRFALHGVWNGKRVEFLPTLQGFVEEAGAPVPRSTLRARLSEVTQFRDLTFNLSLVRLPLLPVDPDRIGLVHRDVPGGQEAMLEASELLDAELERRGRGMPFSEALHWLQSQSPRYGSWTKEIVAAIPRMSVSLVSNRAGIGCADWESVRIPSRLAILRELVDLGEGEASVDEVVARVEEVYGVPLNRASLASLAAHLGLRIEGGRILERAAGDAAPSTGPQA